MSESRKNRIKKWFEENKIDILVSCVVGVATAGAVAAASMYGYKVGDENGFRDGYNRGFKRGEDWMSLCFAYTSKKMVDSGLITKEQYDNVLHESAACKSDLFKQFVNEVKEEVSSNRLV